MSKPACRQKRGAMLSLKHNTKSNLTLKSILDILDQYDALGELALEFNAPISEISNKRTSLRVEIHSALRQSYVAPPPNSLSVSPETVERYRRVGIILNQS